MTFYLRYRLRIWIVAIIGGALYLAIHFFIFDKDFHYHGLPEFILEGRAHILHVAPVVIAFLYLLIKDRIERRSARNSEMRRNTSSDRGAP